MRVWVSGGSEVCLGKLILVLLDFRPFAKIHSNAILYTERRTKGRRRRRRRVLWGRGTKWGERWRAEEFFVGKKGKKRMLGSGAGPFG